MDLSRPGRHRRLPVLRIRTHLALLVLVTAWPLAALLAYTAQRQAKVEEKQAGAQALRAAQAIAAEAERTLQRAQVLLTQVARRPQVRRLDAADCDPLFGAFGSLFPDYTNLVTVRLDGERVCSALPARPDMPAKVDPRLFLAQTLSSQGFTVGPLTRGIFTGRWILLVAYPLRAEAGELVGAVALSIDLGRLPLAPGLGELPRSARARLYDAAGTVLASNPAAPEAVGQPLGAASGAALSGQAPASPPEGRWRDADGVPCIVGTAPVPGTGWRATVGVPVEAVLGPVRRRAMAGAAVSLLGLALAGLLAWLIARRLAGSVEAVAAAARRAAADPAEHGAGLAPLLGAAAPAEVVALADDFTSMLQARSRAEEALRRSEERLRLALRGANDAPWDWHLETGEWFFSERWWDMLGYEGAALAADMDAARRTVHPDDLARLDELVPTALRDGSETFEFEQRLLHRSGRVVPVLVRGFILRDGGGRALRVSGVSSDLSERKRAEAERLALEAQLRESQKMESIGTLAGGVAHDFNNLLGAILGNLALARQEVEAGHPVQASLQQISRASLRARDLVEQILAFSRRRPQTLVVQALQPLVKETLALLRATLPARVELDAALQPTPLFVNADATQIQQVLVNLCTNGWHALQGRAGRIAVGLERVMLEGASARRLDAAPGAYAHLSVSDTGCGMDEATRQRIFEPFFTTKPVGEGTGLGLAVVHGIVATHGGAITAESAPGQGSRFHLYLPLAQPLLPLAAPASAGPPRVVWGHGEPVLYLDDDEVMRVMVERLLQRAGFDVRCCRSARDALAAVSAAAPPFSVVVTDFNMPDASGLDLARELARLQPALPVVIVSGYLSEELRQGSRQLGVRCLLEKQQLFEQLAPAIGRLLAATGTPTERTGR